MHQPLASDFTRLNENALQSLSDLNDLGIKFFERLGEVQLGLMTQLLDVSAQQFKVFTEAKGYQELLDTESGLLNQYNQFLIDKAKTMTDIVNESRQELSRIMEKGLDVVETGPNADPVKTPATRRKVSVSVSNQVQ